MNGSNTVGRRVSRITASMALAVSGAGLLFANPGLAGAAPGSPLSLDGLHSQVLDVTYSPSGNYSMYAAQSGPSLANPGGGLTFQVPQGAEGLVGTHAVYLTTSWAGSLATSNSISVAANWTQSGTYVTRNVKSDYAAIGRLEIQDLTSSGGYNMNDYWWYIGSTLDLNNSSSGAFTASLNDLSNWTNICGLPANDTTTGLTDCMTGKTLTMSPAEGFLNAIQNVREVNIAFGRGGGYASGVATTSATPAYFNLTQLAIN